MRKATAVLMFCLISFGCIGSPPANSSLQLPGNGTGIPSITSYSSVLSSGSPLQCTATVENKEYSVFIRGDPNQRIFYFRLLPEEKQSFFKFGKSCDWMVSMEYTNEPRADMMTFRSPYAIWNCNTAPTTNGKFNLEGNMCILGYYGD